MELPQVDKLLRQGIVEGSRDPAVRETALKITEPIKGGRYLIDARLIFEAVRDGIKYQGDPYGEDVLQSAALTLRRRAGDCNNRIVCLGALLRSIGYPVRPVYVFNQTRPPIPGDYPMHVFLQADVTKGEAGEPQWVDLETTPVRDPVTGYTNVRVDFGNRVHGNYQYLPSEVV